MVAKPHAETPEGPPDKNGARDASLYLISYVSTQVRPMSGHELAALMQQARGKNERLGITGLLLHRGDSFFQVLEGGRSDVWDLYHEIALDARHQRVEIVAEGPVKEREYADWKMAFIELDGQDFSAMPGFSDILQDTPAAREFLRSLSRSKKLALLFSVME